MTTPREVEVGPASGHPIHLGISTCPNDTFAFHGLLTDQVDTRGLRFRIGLHDVQELNQQLAAGRFDAAKGSFHAALRLADEVGVLRTGSALGFGVGPLLLARPGGPPRANDDSVVLCPGEWTTATLLYRLFHGDRGRLRQVVFSQIMPALVRGEADLGICIHEGRFTWAAHGLVLVDDLGAVWERSTEAPLPLGGILARHRLRDRLPELQRVVRESLEFGLAHRDETLPTLQAHAQEMDKEIIWAHVDLYVNALTQDLGAEGARALQILQARAEAAGVVPPDGAPLQILG